MSIGRDKLEEKILEASEAQRWEYAVREWKIVACRDDSSAGSTCICGQHGLRHCYGIRNVLNGRTLYPVGSTCIKEFERQDMVKQVELYGKLFQLWKKYWRREKITLKDFNRRLLRYLYEKGAFRPTNYNFYNPELDYEFMLKMFNQRTEPTYREQKKINALIIYHIIPWLRGRVRASPGA